MSSSTRPASAAPAAPSSASEHEDRSGSPAGDPRTQAFEALEREFELIFTQFRRSAMANASQVSEGMLPGAYKVLTTISRVGSATLSELTEILLTDKGQMSRTIRDLDERGLIDRAPDPSDGRSIRISVSEFGTQRLAMTRGEKEHELRDAMGRWTVSDIVRFTELLHALSLGLTPRTP
ncbi:MULTISPECIES: MarR family winged helix-turn-helix transcriptional regulator [Leucobacter]|uniref:MarR family transcriptional regulator n=1 Tax=Leucobacter manosquensis TaxID=2810611 RepID=A0ABS5M448_9MICO|nr:MarR family transcriptional regulator [Leucobacter manosquensis]MBS3181605.1 MarR family transcriptional regulator [Leucobacter manosquensis]